MMRVSAPTLDRAQHTHRLELLAVLEVCTLQVHQLGSALLDSLASRVSVAAIGHCLIRVQESIHSGLHGVEYIRQAPGAESRVSIGTDEGKAAGRTSSHSRTRQP